MATQVNAQTSTGRNRGGRKGSNQPDAALNIGAGLAVKADQQAVKLTPQADPKSVEGLKIDRPTLDKAAKIVSRFHDESAELQSLKDQADKKRGGLSDICFQLAKLGASVADAPDHRLAACIKVFDAAEAWERQRFQKAKKLEELPTARDALGASWQTYKSQILKCVTAGLNPADFANGTVFREAMSKTGNQARRPRQTAGRADAAVTVMDAFDIATKGMRVELAGAFKLCMEECIKLAEDKQLDFATRIHRVAVAAAKAAKDSEPAGNVSESQEAATGSM